MRRLLLLLFLLVSTPALPDDYDTPIIVNWSAGVDELYLEEIFELFSFQRTKWVNGHEVIVIVLPLESPANRYFITKYLGLSYISYKRRVENRIASGRSDKPIVVQTNADMVKAIAQTKGAVGYLDGVWYFRGSDDAKLIKIK